MVLTLHLVLVLVLVLDARVSSPRTSTAFG
jgi:hypothetical protein